MNKLVDEIMKREITSIDFEDAWVNLFQFRNLTQSQMLVLEGVPEIEYPLTFVFGLLATILAIREFWDFYNDAFRFEDLLRAALTRGNNTLINLVALQFTNVFGDFFDITGEDFDQFFITPEFFVWLGSQKFRVVEQTNEA